MPSSPTHRELLEKIKELAAEAESAQIREQEEVEEQQTSAVTSVESSAAVQAEVAADAEAAAKTKHESVAKVRALMAELNVNVVDILASLGRLEAPLPPYGPGIAAQGRPVSAPRSPRPRKPRNVPYQDDPSLPVRYRDKETGETWSGVGRVPLWIREKELRGYSRDLFLVG